MSAVIETIVLCDDCGHQNSGDDRNLNAAEIRATRKTIGWIQIGKLDYCMHCAPKYQKKRKSK